MKKNRGAALYPALEQYRSEIARCVKCGSCSAVCPSYLVARSESFSPRGRMALVRAVLEGRLRASRVVHDRLATCTACLACEAGCASGVRVTEIIQAAKEQFAGELGRGMIDAVLSTVLKRPLLLRATAVFAPLALHFRGGQKESSKFPRHIHSGAGSVHRSEKGGSAKGRVAFYPGCAVRHFQPDIGRAATAVLSRIGYEVIVPEGLKCCGRPLLSLGDRKGAEELAEHNRLLLAGLDADAVITACASCGLTFKREYPKLLRPGAKTPVFLDIHEFLARELAGLRFAPINETITIHDPCHLGRGQGLSQAVRDVLRKVPGISLVEMNESDRCCGFGGVMRVTHRKLSDGIAEAKVKNIVAAGAEVVVTGCPGCRMQIADALRRAEADVEVLHPVQILEMAMRDE